MDEGDDFDPGRSSIRSDLPFSGAAFQFGVSQESRELPTMLGGVQQSLGVPHQVRTFLTPQESHLEALGMTRGANSVSHFGLPDCRPAPSFLNAFSGRALAGSVLDSERTLLGSGTPQQAPSCEPISIPQSEQNLNLQAESAPQKESASSTNVSLGTPLPVTNPVISPDLPLGQLSLASFLSLISRGQAGLPSLAAASLTGFPMGGNPGKVQRTPHRSEDEDYEDEGDEQDEEETQQTQYFPGQMGDAEVKARVKFACSNCKVAKTKCDLKRPCCRCIRTGRALSCVNSVHKKRGRKKGDHSGLPGTPKPIKTPTGSKKKKRRFGDPDDPEYISTSKPSPVTEEPVERSKTPAFRTVPLSPPVGSPTLTAGAESDSHHLQYIQHSQPLQIPQHPHPFVSRIPSQGLSDPQLSQAHSPSLSRPRRMVRDKAPKIDSTLFDTDDGSDDFEDKEDEENDEKDSQKEEAPTQKPPGYEEATKESLQTAGAGAGDKLLKRRSDVPKGNERVAELMSELAHSLDGRAGAQRIGHEAPVRSADFVLKTSSSTSTLPSRECEGSPEKVLAASIEYIRQLKERAEKAEREREDLKLRATASERKLAEEEKKHADTRQLLQSQTEELKKLRTQSASPSKQVCPRCSGGSGSNGEPASPSSGSFNSRGTPRIMVVVN